MDITLNNKIKIKTKAELLLIDKSEVKSSPTKMSIRIADIKGCVLINQTLIIFGTGLILPYEYKDTDVEYIKRLPNSIQGNKEELEKLYHDINILLQDIPNM